MSDDVNISEHILRELRELRRSNDDQHDALDRKSQERHDKVTKKIDEVREQACSQETCDDNAARLTKVEDRTNKLMVKQATIAGIATGLAIYLKQLLGVDG